MEPNATLIIPGNDNEMEVFAGTQNIANVQVNEILSTLLKTIELHFDFFLKMISFKIEKTYLRQKMVMICALISWHIQSIIKVIYSIRSNRSDKRTSDKTTIFS